VGEVPGRASGWDDLRRSSAGGVIAFLLAVRGYQPGRSSFRRFYTSALVNRLYEAVTAGNRMKHRVLSNAPRIEVHMAGGDPAEVAILRAEMSLIGREVSGMTALERGALQGVFVGSPLRRPPSGSGRARRRWTTRISA
jgi:hypothetical protein